MKAIPLVDDISRCDSGTLCCDTSQLDALHEQATAQTPGAAYGTFVYTEALNDTTGGVFIALDANTIFTPNEGISQQVQLNMTGAFLIPFSEYRRRAGTHPSLEGPDPYGHVLQMMDTPDQLREEALAATLAALSRLPEPRSRQQIIQDASRLPVHSATALAGMLQTQINEQQSELTQVLRTHLPGLVAAYDLKAAYERDNEMLTLDLFTEQGQLDPAPQTHMGRMVAASVYRHLHRATASAQIRADLERQADALERVMSSGRLDQLTTEWRRDPLLVGLPVHEVLIAEGEPINDVQWEWNDDVTQLATELRALAKVAL